MVPAAAESYRRASRSALRARLTATRLEGCHLGSTNVITGVFVALVAWAGGRLALEDAIGIDELVAAGGSYAALWSAWSRASSAPLR